MATSREISSSRPTSSTNFPHRNPSYSRQHAHSVSLGAMNPTHRVSRRKSVNSTNVGSAAHALAAALREHGGHGSAATTAHRRSLGSRKGPESTSAGNVSSMGMFSSRPELPFAHPNVRDHAASAALMADEDAGEDGLVVDQPVNLEPRNRRASEGCHLVRSEGKRFASELRCDTCGKGYKHSSCLTKHMWEHDPAWAVTSKLLISKHQQVQLLEAASVLINMNVEGCTPPDPSHIHESEASSESPEFSGSSVMQDERELSSTETTPPPMSDTAVFVPTSKRLSTSSAGFSRSFRSVPSSSFVESLSSPNLFPQRLSNGDLCPSTSGTDDAGLAAAAELLNFGTPRTRPTMLSSDVPPVPPLPEQYQAANRLSRNSSNPIVYNPLCMHPINQPLSDEREIKVEDQDGRPPANLAQGTNVDDDEDAMFRMEE